MNATGTSSRLVSVCLITFNQARFIGQALDSILAQRTQHRIEVLVGDDASTDGTREILADYAARHPDVIKPILRDVNIGMMHNFVDVYERCAGDYLCPLEGDDRWCSPHKVERQVAFLEAHPDCAVCFHDTRVFHEAGAFAPHRLPGPRFPHRRTIGDAVQGNFAQTPSIMYRHGLVPTLPGWYVELGLGDWTLLLLHAAHGYIAYLPVVMAEYRVHAAGVWSQQVPAFRLERWIAACRRMDRVFHGRFADEFGVQIAGYHARLAHGMTRERWLAHGREIGVGRLRNRSPRHFLVYHSQVLLERLRQSQAIRALHTGVKRRLRGV